MCGIVGAAAQPQHRPGPDRRPAGASSTAATTPAASPCWTATASSACAASRASPTSRRRSRADSCAARPASRTRAGRRTARRSTENAHPHRLARRDRAWCTTASSRTTRSCAPSCKAKGYALREPDRHRGDRAPGAQPVRRRPVRRGAARGEAAEGAYAIAVVSKKRAARVVGARAGSPLVVGVGKGENFLASDALALAGTTDRIAYLEEGDVVEIELDGCRVVDARRPRGDARGAHRQDERRGGRARALPALHAEGDLRAAARGRRHAGGRRSDHAGAVRRRARERVLRGVELGADPRLRHQLLRRA